jgi:hypothetical protein
VGLEGHRIEVAALVKALIQAVTDYTQSPLAPVPEACAASGAATFLRREDAERFIEEVPGDHPGIARHLRSRSGGAR